MTKKKKVAYRSKAEAKFAEYLKENNIYFEYETIVLPYEVQEIRKYTPDFVLDDFIIEFKGKFDTDARKKMKLIKKQYPDKDIRLVFMQDNRITKTSKTRYSDWARKNGFKYHIGISLPKEWIKELQ